MVDSLVKLRNKFVHFLFPYIERIYLVLSLALLIGAWSMPVTYWRIRVLLFWLWLIEMCIYGEGVMERDYLPIQPANSRFYHIYRFCDAIIFLILLLWLVIVLLPPSSLLLAVFIGLILLVFIIRAIGDKKYRPKKPEEEEHFL